MNQLKTTKDVLPLVSFGPGVFDKSKIEVVIDKEKNNIAQSGLPDYVVRSIMRQNAERRFSEAHDTYRDFFDTLEDCTVEELNNYSELRAREGDMLTPDERIDLFLSNKFIKGYEFYARMRLGESALLDSSFAGNCLKSVCRRREDMEEIETIPRYSLPKVTRRIGNFAVVTAKITVGGMRNLETDEEYSIKSRQAGVVDLDQVDDPTAKLLDRLAKAKPSEDKYVSDRLDVRDFLQSSLTSPSIKPVIESDYITRQAVER